MPVLPPPSPEVARARARVATNVRHGHHDAADEARRDLLAAKLAEQIKRAVAGAPPLTDEQRRRLAAIIRGGTE
jgi:hypothetical protein